MGLKIHLRYLAASSFILLSALRKYHSVLIFWSELETNSLLSAYQLVSSPDPGGQQCWSSVEAHTG